MAAGRIIFPGWMPAEEANGDRVPYARAYIYENLTTTLANTYTTSGLSVANANPVVADSAGNFPAIWSDTANLFTVALTDGDGVPLTSPWDGVSASGTLDSVALAEDAYDRAEAAAERAEAAANGIDTVATSTTTLTVGTGSKAVTLAQTGKSYAVGMPVVIADTATGANRMAGVVTAFVDPLLTVSVDTTAGSGSIGAWTISQVPPGGVSSVAGESGIVTAAELKSALSLTLVDDAAVLGRHQIPVPGEALVPQNTNGPALGLAETATNKVMIQTWDFDKDAPEYAQRAIPMPKSWDEGTVTFQPIWSHAATTTNFKVSWGLQGLALSDGDALDAAFGTAQYSNDTGGTTNTLYTGPESAAITIAGSPAAGDTVIFRVLRKADDATNDTLAIDARLHGIVLYITTNAGNDA